MEEVCSGRFDAYNLQGGGICRWGCQARLFLDHALRELDKARENMRKVDGLLASGLGSPASQENVVDGTLEALMDNRNAILESIRLVSCKCFDD